MIRIEIWHDHLIVSGHANAAEKGKDIYCAGVSAIVMGALNWFKSEEVRFTIDDGYINLEIIDSSNKKVLDMFSLLVIQLLALGSNENRKFIKIIDHSKGEKNE